MKVFSLGFILAFIASALFQHINITTVKEFFESMIVILPLILLLIFICWQGIKSSYLYLTYKKLKKIFPSSENNWGCLLIDGVWGSGKTTHYETYYQYIDDKPNIYISCFSASRSELIAQIIQQQFWCRLLTLNGLLAKIMESNWQIFMPKNRIVVFDDLERLHSNQDNYLDLIGIIDYLKMTNKCKIILICNMSELNKQEEQKQHIFNTYMERIVDNVEFVPKLLDLLELFSKPTNKHNSTHVNLASPIIQKIITTYQGFYNDDKLKNLRIIKTSISDFANKLNIKYPESGIWDKKKQIIFAETYANELTKNTLIRYLFFVDYKFFNEIIKFTTDQNVNTMLQPDTTRLDQQKPLVDESPDILASKLKQYNHELKLTDFQYAKDGYSQLPMVMLNEEKCVLFALNNLHKLAALKAEYIGAIERNIITIFNACSFKVAQRFIQIGAYKDQYNSLLLQEWKKYIIQYVRNYQNRIHLFHSIRMGNRTNYIENFALATLFSKLDLADHCNKLIDSIAFNLKLGRIPFDKVIKSREFFWEELGNSFDVSGEEHPYTKNNPHEKGISFKMHVMALILEKYIYWFIDDNFSCSKILKELNLHYKKVLSIVEERRITGEYVYLDSDNPSINIRI